MSERAYSLELNDIIDAKTAVYYSMEGKLKDKHAFVCCDEKCKIPLTCTNWKNSKGVRFCFVPSNHNKLHHDNCSENFSKIDKKKITKNNLNSKKITIKNNVIKIVKHSDKKTSKREDNNEDNEIQNNKHSNLKSSTNSVTNGLENSTWSSMSFIVEEYKRNTNRVIEINKEKLAFSEFFVDDNSKIVFDKVRVFCGEAFLKTSAEYPGALEIEFININIPNIPTNIKSLGKIHSGNDIKEYIDRERRVIAYWRGSLYEYNNYKDKNIEIRYKKYNDMFYRDLYFEVL